MKFEESPYIETAYKDGSKGIAVRDAEPYFQKLGSTITAKRLRAEKAAASMYLELGGKSASRSFLSDFNHQPPYVAFFHFGNQKEDENGWQIFIAEGGGLALEWLKRTFMDALLNNEKSRNDLADDWANATAQRRREIVRFIDSVIKKWEPHQ
jgi:hypothetical protein